ncbi:MAG: RNase adapter RapZ [Gammaproteobacteria bacterium]
MGLSIISGLSGSGKSVALDMLEDLDFYCVDNIPTRILSLVIDELLATGDARFEKIAIGLDTKPGPNDSDQISDLVGRLRQDGIPCKVVFLQAETAVLLNRYSETRRRHPLTSRGVGLKDAIALERELLAPISDLAEFVVDTSRMSVHDLREAIRDRLTESKDQQLTLLFRSFGYKNGMPGDADFVFDARCLPNPYWKINLRGQTGRDSEVEQYLESHAAVSRYVDDIALFLERWVPEFRKSNRSYLTVAVGCTGGQHRSVYVVEKLAAQFDKASHQILLRHSELPD